MKKLIALGLILSASAVLAQTRDRLPRECRREIIRLCLGSRGDGGIRECLARKAGEVSPECRDQIGERVRDRMATAERSATPALAAEMRALGAVEHSYGSDGAQKLDFYSAGGGQRPVILFVHGGGWSRGDKANATGAAKVKHYRAQGFHLASINYRLVPGASVEQQAEDVTAALKWMRSNAAKLGVDTGKVVLMGHSAGAHLVALVGSDPRYLQQAGLNFGAVAGIVPIDGAAYDVTAQMRDGPRIMQQVYRAAFGTDPARQTRLSPTAHAAAPNAPAFLLLHVEREDGARQSAALAEALRKGGSAVQLNGFEGKGAQGHRDINRKLGEADYPATPVVDAWLKALFK